MDKNFIIDLIENGGEISDSEQVDDSEYEEQVEEQAVEEQAEVGHKTRHKSLTNVTLSMLPPLPIPRHNKQRERNGGIIVVLLSIFFFVGTTHGLALEAFDGFEYHSTIWWVLFILIYSQAGLAILGLMAMLMVDPGAVPRSQQTCFPIPEQMTPALRDYLEHKGDGVRLFVPPGNNYLAALDRSGDTYCVRCLVWRRSKDGKHYHCNTCQRCVKDYDHHCSVFGRCIAGRLLSIQGNYTFFVSMCALFVTAFFTSFVAIVWSISNIYGPAWVVPIACLVILYFAVTTRLLVTGPMALCRTCRRR
ncbi:unnamed protein product [Cylindrotheca closterium]|uniref:Palmitoyltransferase n=1 Tax=Cylindrotheca closterium TaxID=2856 RepID=A0AAD2FJX2_9STRA|nr:unnamed protein product [Cylindrotheca closterium]